MPEFLKSEFDDKIMASEDNEADLQPEEELKDDINNSMQVLPPGSAL